MIPPTWLVGGVVALTLISGLGGFSTGYNVRSNKAKVEAAEMAEASRKLEDELRAQVAELSTKYEDASSSVVYAGTRTVNTIREIYRDVEVPAVCVPPADAVGLLNLQIERANTAASGKPSR